MVGLVAGREDVAVRLAPGGARDALGGIVMRGGRVAVSYQLSAVSFGRRSNETLSDIRVPTSWNVVFFSGSELSTVDCRLSTSSIDCRFSKCP
jgi:hypothetical protein